MNLDQVVARPKMAAAPEVGAAAPGTVLLEHAIHTTSAEFRQQEIASKKSIANQNLPCIQVVQQTAKQRLFVVALAMIGTGGRIQQRAAA